MVIDVGEVVKGARCLVIAVACAWCATCTTPKSPNEEHSERHVAEKAYGLRPSPRATRSKYIRKGGSRYIVGNPYVVRGTRYYPKEDPSYDRKGKASWYGAAFKGRRTANNEVYHPDRLSAAHPTLPLPSYVRVTNLENGFSLILRVNDRGPYRQGRIIDVSSKAANMLDLKHRGTASVRVQYMGRARLDGHDEPYLMASYVKTRDRLPEVDPKVQSASEIRVASNSSSVDHLRGDGQSLRSAPANLVASTANLSYQAWIGAGTSEQMGTSPESASVSFERSSDSGAKVHDIKDVKYCLEEAADTGARDMCEVKVPPLPVFNRLRRLIGVISKRRRALNGYRWLTRIASFGARRERCSTLT
ncbi:septal ring lytic transglycosylase RlpA family protein [Ensifer adhaerens]|nr:septal ring lytic transglycosylase RlpA family protein [Ensifer adhaerens]UAX97332.1 septal ring lytic transglycosylase RlpA family protein [Ensifer adhaerens]UAY03549.1 septal ring lytic transglycosylase RlpA family protein [Ensifer adhaerens]UAY11533.1 septal ring lytic transglycosylase RlpA family protein [Ensifer adhaerens]